MNFVEIANVCARKAIIKAAKRITNSDKMCRSYSDLNLASFFGTQSYRLMINKHVCFLYEDQQEAWRSQRDGATAAWASFGQM